MECLKNEALLKYLRVYPKNDGLNKNGLFKKVTGAKEFNAGNHDPFH